MALLAPNMKLKENLNSNASNRKLNFTLYKYYL